MAAARTKVDPLEALAHSKRVAVRDKENITLRMPTPLLTKTDRIKLLMELRGVKVTREQIVSLAVEEFYRDVDTSKLDALS